MYGGTQQKKHQPFNSPRHGEQSFTYWFYQTFSYDFIKILVKRTSKYGEQVKNTLKSLCRKSLLTQ